MRIMPTTTTTTTMTMMLARIKRTRKRTRTRTRTKMEKTDRLSSAFLAFSSKRTRSRTRTSCRKRRRKTPTLLIAMMRMVLKMTMPVWLPVLKPMLMLMPMPLARRRTSFDSAQKCRRQIRRIRAGSEVDPETPALEMAVRKCRICGENTKANKTDRHERTDATNSPNRYQCERV